MSTKFSLLSILSIFVHIHFSLNELTWPSLNRLWVCSIHPKQIHSISLMRMFEERNDSFRGHYLNLGQKMSSAKSNVPVCLVGCCFLQSSHGNTNSSFRRKYWFTWLAPLDNKNFLGFLFHSFCLQRDLLLTDSGKLKRNSISGKSPIAR